ncbi:LCP family protein [Acaryochloris sp. IP29b_bin.148]|uniref:LCP family protein n=1 Tax=Acaryochloris sp. IP29b_bin.148 TaxID=2969218 RepID=UPI002605929F|nr:LCP family protein [Acaryochloris sp. IP29b_bin.148]
MADNTLNSANVKKGAFPTKRQSKRRAASESRASRQHKTSKIVQPQRTNRMDKVFRWLTWGVIFSFAMTLSAGLGATLALVAPVRLLGDKDGPVSLPELFQGGLRYGISRPVNIIVMGVDLNLEEPEEGEVFDPFKSRSDTMLLVRLNPGEDRVSILSIPRDTRVEIPDVGITKINSANWWGGPDLVTEVVSKTLNDVQIDRYVRVSTGAFRELVDVVGGVEVYVPIAMQYEDQTQKLKIDLQPGLQELNGEEAEGFVRFRNNNLGDIGRAQRQQILLKALQKKMANPTMLTRLPQILSVLQKHIDSNLSVGEMLALMQFGLQVDSDQLQMVLLPGRFSGPEEYELSFWLMDLVGMDRVMQTYFEVSPPVGYEVATRDPSEFKDIRIVVQNATDDPEGDSVMIEYLQTQGFYNVHYADEDWPQPLSKTQVIPQWGDLESAEYLQTLLEESQLLANSTGDLGSDLTIRVGQDWLRNQPSNVPDS